MVGKILAHVDYLDESIADLSAEIERVNFAPFSRRRSNSSTPSQALSAGWLRP
jgi:hypothetical protein